MTFRKLIVKDAEWTYYIGKTSAVLRAPDGRKKTVGLDVLTGRSFDILDRGRWKKSSDGMMTPSDVAAYIEKCEEHV